MQDNPNCETVLQFHAVYAAMLSELERIQEEKRYCFPYAGTLCSKERQNLL